MHPVWLSRSLALIVLATACGSSSQPTSKPPSPSTPPSTPPSARPDELSNVAQAAPTTGTPASGPRAATPGLALTAIDPPKGDTQGGTYVLLEGKNFINDGPRNVKVYFGSRQGTVVRFQSDNQLIVQAPGGKPNEVVDVLVVFDPGGQLKLPGAFTFVDKAP